MNNKTTAPKVGDGATICFWSDRKAATVVAVSPSGKTIQIQLDDARRISTNWLREAQEYEYTRNPEGPTYKVMLKKDRKYRTSSKNLVVFGVRNEHYDPHF